MNREYGRSGCDYPDCDRPHYGKGLCQGHWQQKHRNGKELSPIQSPRKTPIRCAFRDCNRKATRKDLCDAHYRQLERGEDLRTLLHEEDFLTRLMRLVTVDESTGCWNTDKPRAKMSWRGVHDITYRHAYRELLGSLSSGTSQNRGETVDHLCLNSHCCNPDHLEKVSARENTKRMQMHTALQARIERLEEQVRSLGAEPVD